jgi:hypothetical protein
LRTNRADYAAHNRFFGLPPFLLWVFFTQKLFSVKIKCLTATREKQMERKCSNCKHFDTQTTCNNCVIGQLWEPKKPVLILEKEIKT